MMELIVKDLHMDKYVDNKALKDLARYYYPSKNLDQILICKTTGKKINLDTYLKKATLQNNKEALIKKIGLMRKRSKIAAKRRKTAVIGKKSVNSSSKRKIPLPSTNNSEFFVYDKIYKYDITEIANNINFMDVISNYEDIIQEEQNSDGIKIKTADKNTYQFFDNKNILCDLKKDNMSFNIYSYIKNHFECNSKEVLQHMNQYTDTDSFKSVNEDWQDAIVKSLDISTNRKEFEINLIELLDFRNITVKKENEDVIYVTGQKFHISDFEIEEYKTKSDIVKKFQKNRGKKQKKRKPLSQIMNGVTENLYPLI